MNATEMRTKFPDPIPVLDHGFVRFLDCMGDDSAIVSAARVSYEGSRATDAGGFAKDRNLLRYLMRHRHTSPFEMAEIKLGLKMPIAVARQHVRHRTASINEVSARYSEVPTDTYAPGPAGWREQAVENKQGSGRIHPYGESCDDWAVPAMAAARTAYDVMLENGVAKEQARLVLPLATYTEMIWKIDLHNLLHYLALRLDSHAQWEIRVYAEAIAKIVAAWCPLAWEAFEDYHPLRGGRALSRMESAMVRALVLRETGDALDSWQTMGERERREFSAWLGVDDASLMLAGMR